MGLFNRRNANPDQPKLPLMKSAVIALLRHLLTFIGGTLVAKGIIELHGGALTAESVAGEGSTFTFTIPA